MPLNADVLSHLRQMTGAAQVLTAKEDLFAYSFDGIAAL